VVFDEESGTVIDGGTGLDRLVLNSTSLRDGAGYAVVLRSNGGGSAHLFQNHFVNTVLDTTGVEVVQLTGGNGQDSFSLTDLTGSGVTFVSLDLGGGINDLVRDDVAISGTAGRDVIEVRDTNDGDLGILGLPATVVVTHIDAAAFTGGPHDNVFIRTGAGDDFIDMRNMNFDHAVIIDAGAGNDTILAGFGPALFVYSRTGNADTISGFRGVNGGGHDRMDVSAIGDHSFAEMIQHRHLFQQGANVIIDDTQGSFVVLQNVNLSSLSAADFLFA